MDADRHQLELRAALERLYAVFARYPADQTMHACPHCVSPDDKARLLARPLRELDADDLHYYAWKAMTTFGTVEDFKHFLPRIFEVMIGESPQGKNEQVVLRKCRTGSGGPGRVANSRRSRFSGPPTGSTS